MVLTVCVNVCDNECVTNEQQTCQSSGFKHDHVGTYMIKDGPALDRDVWTPGDDITLCEGCAIFARSHLAQFDGLQIER